MKNLTKEQMKTVVAGQRSASKGNANLAKSRTK